MVVVRAQDFASRTLRRVGGELANLSREQQILRATDTTRIKSAKALTKAMEAQTRLDVLRPLRQREVILRRLAPLEQKLAQIGGPAPAWTTQGRVLVPQINALKTALQGVDQQIGQLPPRFARWSGDTVRLASETRKANVALREAQMLQRHAATDLSALSQAMRGIPLERLDNAGRALSGMGRTLQLFGMVGTAAMGLAARQAAEFSTDLGLAATQARNLTQDAKDLPAVSKRLEEGFRSQGKEVKGIIDLMGMYPASADEMSAATYEIFSGMQLEENGIVNVAKGLGLLETANKIAVAGGTDLAEATSAMITVFNNFGDSTEEQAKNLDSMFDIVRFGRMRMSEFNLMMNKVAPAAADAGQSLEDIGGAMAVLTTLMPSQRMVATGLSRALEALAHPDVVKGLEMHGVAVRDTTGQMRSFYDIIRDIEKEFPALTEGGLTVAEFFRTITAEARGGGRGLTFTQEGRRAISELIHNMDLYIERQDQVVKNQNEFNEAFKAQLKTPGVQWAIFVNQLRQLILVIGQEAIPVFAQIGDAIKGMLDWWKRLSPETRGTIVQMVTLLSVLSLLSGVFLAIFGSLLTFEAMLRRLAISGGAASGILGTVLALAQRLAVLGAIVLTIHVLRGGEMGLWQLLGATAAGAALGLGIGGPAGAIVGAFTLPLVLKIIEGEQKSPIEKAFEQYRVDFQQERSRFQGWLAGQPKFLGTDIGVPDFLNPARLIQSTPEDMMKFDEFQAEWKRTVKFVNNNKFSTRNIDAYASSLANARKEFPLLDMVMEEHSQQTKKQGGLMDVLDKATKRYISGLKGDAKKAAQEQAAQMRALAEELANGGQNMGEFTDRMEEYNKQLADTTRQATQSVMDSLRSMYTQMQDENERAMGQLFQGPWLTSETFDLAKEWGIAPQIQDIIRDIDAQIDQFNQRRRMIDTLFKRGLPTEFLDELRGMTAEEAMPILTELVNATPRETQKLIQKLNQRQAEIKRATQIDFTREINQFKAAGVSMGEAIKNGFQSAQVGQWFDNWVRQNFPSVIRSAVNSAVNEWKQANPPPVRPAGATTRVPGGVGTQTTTTQTTTTNDRSKTANIHVTVGDTAGSRAVDERNREAMRQVAFASNALLQGWF